MNQVYKINMRHVSPAQLHRARGMLQRIRREGAETPNPVNKAVFILSAFYGAEGEKSYKRVRQMLIKNLGAETVNLCDQALAAQIAKPDDHLDILFREKQDASTDDERNLVREKIIRTLFRAGRMDEAIDATWSLLKDAKNHPNLARRLALHLINVGQRKKLATEHPALVDKLPRLKTSLSFPDATAPSVPVFCLNLDRDSDRLKRAERMLASPATQFQRIPGVSGSTLPQAFLDRSGIPISVPRRAQVGCHLGHIAAWEQLANSVPEGEYGLVAEDDAVFFFGPGIGLSTAVEKAKEAKLDLLFLQAEPVAWLIESDGLTVPDGLQLIPTDVLGKRPEMLQVFGWGGEGYLMTPAGARQLIALSMELGIRTSLDNQIASYGMEEMPAATEKFNEVWQLIFDPLQDYRKKHPEAGTIRSAVCYPPLMEQVDFGKKTHLTEVAMEKEKRVFKA